MSYFDFMAQNPLVGSLLTIVIFALLCGTVFRMWNRALRCLNIRKHGYPPIHCDADGDFKEDQAP